MRWKVATAFCLGFALVGIQAFGQGRDPSQLIVPTGPREPADEAKGFHLPPGFEAQLVAAEPQIHKPINIAFDARGRLWVTDTVEYPFPVTDGKTGRDSVKILEDFGPDGHARKVTTFADGLNIPVGVLPVGTNGAIVYSIPAIYHMVDTLGTGHADQRTVLLSGQAHDDTHGMTGSFTEGFDGLIYAVHGFRNSSVVRGVDGSTLDMNSGNTYRFRTDGTHLEQFTHGQVNPFGLAFDPLGNLYSSDCETKPIYMLLRGGYYPSFGKPDDGLGFAPEMCDHLYGSTAIAGLVDYVADSYPAGFRNMMLVGNVVTAKINRAQLSPRGSAFHADDAPDFLSSDDKWFRPVNIKLGPDGALYVADFYNKIIGHYEVDLHHPGRDRERGRIWRIVYTGVGGNDVKPQAAKPFDLTTSTIPELIAYLSDANFTVRMLAMNFLADQTGQSAVAPLKQALAGTASTELRVHGMWVLKRLGALDDSMLKALFTAGSDHAVRAHAMRILAEIPNWNAQQRQLALAELADADPLVKRCAADALGQHPSIENVRLLLDARQHASAADTHLVYTLRMALRNQLNASDVADRLPPPGASEQDVRDLTDVALGAASVESAGLIFKSLPTAPEDTDVLSHDVQHIARFGNDALTDLAAKEISSRFGRNDGLQLLLFKAIQEGITRRNGHLGESAQAWGQALATRLLNSPEEDFAGWINSPAAGFPEAKNPWSMQMRASADGNAASTFISSLPLGEIGTGVFKSKEFVIPARLSFYFAGHSGPPTAQNTMKNVVRLRDAESGKTLGEAPAPRNDLARKVEWDLSASAGRRGYIEATDADNGTAYAWIAFGRFEPAVVPLPTTGEHPLRTAIEIAAELQLTDQGKRIADLLADKKADTETRTAAAKAMGALNPSEHVQVLSAVLTDPTQPEALRDAAGSSLAQTTGLKSDISNTVCDAFVTAIHAAPLKLQLSLAKSLAASTPGAESLLDAVGQGKASARLLLDPTLRERLNVAKPANLDQRLSQLTANLPPADQAVQKLIADRVAQFNRTREKASVERGAKAFVANCQVCHRVSGVGSQIGPQLDGIGVRGPARLAEDILDPSRNVDAAFRATTFVLDSGDVIAGIPRREEGELLVVAESTGKEISIKKSTVKRRVESKISLMPSNFGDVLKPDDFNDLLTYLLSK